jgi:hypothetical protein
MNNEKPDNLGLYVDLYRHEDLMIWTKLRFVITFNSLLLAAWVFINDKGIVLQIEIPSRLIPVIGFFSSILLMKTLINGRGYLRKYADQWRPYLYPNDESTKPLYGSRILATSTISIFFTGIVSIMWIGVILVLTR